MTGASTADIVVSVIIIALLLIILVAAIWSLNRRRQTFLRHQRAIYRAGAHTLSIADTANEKLERAGNRLSKSARRSMERANELRETARHSLERGATDADLILGSRAAAEAVVLLRRARRTLDLPEPVPQPPTRCFYCGEEREPYREEAITGENNATLQILVCPVCTEEQSAGRRPKLAVAESFGTIVPWWAVPNNAWYVAYGGEAWQYWLPYATETDLADWFTESGQFLARPPA